MGCVVSVEHVVISFSTLENNKTVTLTKGQNWAQCVPMFQSMLKGEGGVTSDGDGNNSQFRVTTGISASLEPEVTIVRYSPGGTSAEVSVYIVEFIDDITVTPYTGSTTNYQLNRTIPSVDTASTFVVGSLYTAYAPNGATYQAHLLYLSSATVVRLYRYNSSTAMTVYYAFYVVEDSTGGTHFKTQYKTCHMLDATLIGTGTVTGMDRDKTFILPSHYCESSTNDGEYGSVRYFFQGDYNCVAQRQLGGAGKSHAAIIQFVEIQADDAVVVHGLTTIASGWDSTSSLIGQTLGEYATAWAPSGTYYGGCYGALTTENYYATGQLRCQLDPTFRDRLNVTRDSTSDALVYMGWEAIDFGGYAQRRIFIT